jgi:hypothetical protein
MAIVQIIWQANTPSVFVEVIEHCLQRPLMLQRVGAWP